MCLVAVFLFFGTFLWCFKGGHMKKSMPRQPGDGSVAQTCLSWCAFLQIWIHKEKHCLKRGRMSQVHGQAIIWGIDGWQGSALSWWDTQREGEAHQWVLVHGGFPGPQGSGCQRMGGLHVFHPTTADKLKSIRWNHDKAGTWKHLAAVACCTRKYGNEGERQVYMAGYQPERNGMVTGGYQSVVQANSPEPKRELGNWVWDGCSGVAEGMTLPECIIGWDP